MIETLRRWAAEIWHSNILWFVPAFVCLIGALALEDVTDAGRVNGWVGWPVSGLLILLGLLFAEMGRE